MLVTTTKDTHIDANKVIQISLKQALRERANVTAANLNTVNLIAKDFAAHEAKVGNNLPTSTPTCIWLCYRCAVGEKQPNPGPLHQGPCDSCGIDSMLHSYSL